MTNTDSPYIVHYLVSTSPFLDDGWHYVYLFSPSFLCQRHRSYYHRLRIRYDVSRVNLIRAVCSLLNWRRPCNQLGIKIQINQWTHNSTDSRARPELDDQSPLTTEVRGVLLDPKFAIPTSRWMPSKVEVSCPRGVGDLHCH